MTDVLNMWRRPDSRPADARSVVSQAMGFVDLAGKVAAVENHVDFPQLLSHLKMLAGTTVVQNAPSVVTDGDANKVIELYIAALAMTAGSNISLDDPNHSKGDNPDVMLDFRGKRWALALKTLHSRKPQTLFDNIKKASDQIEASAADHGLVVLNVKNELDYGALWPSASSSQPEEMVKAELHHQICAIAHQLDVFEPEEWRDILGPARKAVPPVLFFGQAVSSAIPAEGRQPFFMSLKCMMTYLTPSPDTTGGLRLANHLNDAAQRFT